MPKYAKQIFGGKLTMENWHSASERFLDHLQSRDPKTALILKKTRSPWNYDRRGKWRRKPGRRERKKLKKLYGEICNYLGDTMRTHRKDFEKNLEENIEDPHDLWKALRKKANYISKAELQIENDITGS